MNIIRFNFGVAMFIHAMTIYMQSLSRTESIGEKEVMRLPCVVMLQFVKTRVIYINENI